MNIEKAIQKAQNKVSIPFDNPCAKSVFGFRGQAKGKLFLGIEVEYEIEKQSLPEDVSDYDELSDYYGDGLYYKELTKHIDRINKNVGHFAVIKNDGSLKHGIEIASAPSGYRSHIYQWNRFFNNLKNHKLEAASNCGMHVHVSKKRLSDRQRKNLPLFFNPTNKPFMEKISGRKENKYCIYKLTGKVKREALNRIPDYTWEFRIFAAPKTREEFVIRLQFVKSLIEFCNTKNYINTFEKYKEFLSKQKSYTELKKFLEKEKI